MKEFFRSLGLALIRVVGTTIIESSSKQVLGKALVVTWRGEIHVIGYEGPPVVPYFLEEKKVTYWRFRIGFKTMPQVDYPHIVSTSKYE